MSKKILSIILAISMVLTMCVGAFSVSAAEGDVTISCGGTEGFITGKAGDIIEIPVSVSGNKKGISAVTIHLEYDDTYLEIGEEDFSREGSIMNAKGMVMEMMNPKTTDEELYPDAKAVAKYSYSHIEAIHSGDGLLTTFMFKVKEDANISAKTAIKVHVTALSYWNNDVLNPVTVAGIEQPAPIVVNPEVNVTLPAQTKVTYDGQPHAVAATVPEGVAVEVKYNGKTEAPTAVGTYEVTATATEGFIGSAKGTLVIEPIKVTVNATNVTKKIGEDDPALAYTYNEDALLAGDKLVGGLTRAAGEAIGKYPITQAAGNEFKVVKEADSSVNANYVVTFVPGELEIVDKTPQTITVSETKLEKTYGDASVKLTATASSGLTGFTFASSDDKVATVDGEGNVTFVGAGEAKITVSQAGDDDYAPASADVAVTVNPAALTITLAEKEITYGEEIGEFDITYEGFVNEETKDDLLTPVTVAGLPESKVIAGTYPLTLEGATSDNYTISYTNADLIVNPREVEIASIGVYNKNADETTDAKINPTKIALTEGKDFIAGDDVYVSVTGTAAFADAEAGEDKVVTISDVAVEVTGKDKDNYTVTVADSALTTTATIFADGSMTAQDVADQIGDITIKAGDDTVVLPDAPDGFTFTLTGSDKPEVIDPETGAITRTNEEETVVITITVTAEDGTTATKDVTVKVAKGSLKTITAKVWGNGSLQGDFGDQPIGGTIEVIAVPDKGYEVSEWFVNGESIGKTNATVQRFTVEDDMEIGVEFKRKSGGGIPSTGTGGGVTVKAPTASVTSGSTVFKGSVVKLSTMTSGAKIYYTTDGSTPTTSNATLYTSEGIRISANTTIKAFAMKDSKTSTVASFTYKMKTAKAEFKDDANKIKYMESVSDKLFEPDRAATRYEVLKALDEVMDIEDAKIENGFSDVPEGYKELVNKFAATSIVDGYPNKTFGGEGNITRAEFVKMLAAALDLDMSAAATHKFKDVQSGHWAEKYIAAFSKLGYIIGDPDGNFRPDDKVTRAEVVTVMNRILKIESAPNAAQKYTDLAKEHWAYGFIMAAAKDK